ncbi:MAG TPA: hypothetical protein VMS71_05480 [Candidatus Acidoferrum sp.]|nr:hypothetical protein [Candidatus Acidoferrum sp.]
MTCREYQEELVLAFGQPTMPAELAGHLERCEECRAYWQDLSRFADGTGDDDLFAPDENESQWLMNRIERELDRREHPVRKTMSLFRYAALAASVVLAVGITVIGIRYSANRGQSGTVIVADSGQTLAPVRGQANTADSTMTTPSLGDSEIRLLIQDYTSGTGQGIDENLLNGLSDEEIKYLEANLTKGDLL